MNASEPREDAVAVLQRLLASHKDYTQSQQRGWPAHDKGYPNLKWSLEIEHSAEALLAALAQQGAEPVAWQRAVDEADAAELFSDGLSGDLHSAGIDTIEAAYMEGRKNVIQEIRDLAREKAATGAHR